MIPPETTVSIFFFSRHWDSHNQNSQNSQLKKFEKKSVVSFCRRWTFLKYCDRRNGNTLQDTGYFKENLMIHSYPKIIRAGQPRGDF